MIRRPRSRNFRSRSRNFRTPSTHDARNTRRTSPASPLNKRPVELFGKWPIRPPRSLEDGLAIALPPREPLSCPHDTGLALQPHLEYDTEDGSLAPPSTDGPQLRGVA